MTDVDPSQEAFRHWSTVAEAWERHRERLFASTRAVSDRLVELVDPQPGQTLLEVTAGPGETGFLAAPRLQPGGTLISSDFVPEMVEAAKRGAAAQGLDNVEHRVLDASAIDLPDDSVDGVISRYGLMLVPEQERAMAEIRRVLRPGGRCAFATWGPPDRNPWIFSIVAALLQNGYAPPGDPTAPGGIFSLPTPEQCIAYAERAGFTDVTAEYVEAAMTFSDPDDYWSFNTSLAGPIADLVRSSSPEQIAAVRATLDPSLAPFERDGGLELPALTVVTRAS